MKVAIGVVAAIVIIGGGFLLMNRTSDSKDDAAAPSQATTTKMEEKVPAMNIVEIAASNPDFSTLVTAVKAAGLVDTLSGTGPFTVFAPTNAAFDKLPAGTLESLLKDPAKLKEILTYHVVAGDVKAAAVVNLTKATTVLGKDVSISVNGSTVKVNDATVTKTDIAASNGTIHVIDTVLLPPTN